MNWFKQHLNWALLLALPCFLLLSLIGCQTTAPLTGVEVYNNTEYGFSVSYPLDWEVLEDVYPSGMGKTITFFKEGAAAVYIYAWEPSESTLFVSLDDFYDRGVISGWQDHEGFKILEEHNTLVDQLPAREVTFVYKTTDLVWKYAVIAFLDTRDEKAITDSNAFKIIYDMPVAMFDNHYGDFRLIADTFTFTG